MIYFYCNRPSTGLRALRKTLRNKYKIKSLKIDETSRPKAGRTIINWGTTVAPQWFGVYINHTVGHAVNKLTAFKQLKDANISIPDFTEDVAVANEWLRDGTVFARTVLNGSEGKGIVVVEPGGILPKAPLYVKYVKKLKEFRVHVMGGKAIDVQEKRKKRGFEGDRDTKVRNTANGYIFAREDMQVPDGCVEEAIKAVKALNLFFGAVDIVWNKKYNKCYVLEINTAPGIEGTSVERYADSFVQTLQLG